MVDFFIMEIRDGAITIEDVPERWRAKVEATLKEV